MKTDRRTKVVRTAGRVGLSLVYLLATVDDLRRHGLSPWLAALLNLCGLVLLLFRHRYSGRVLVVECLLSSAVGLVGGAQFLFLITALYTFATLHRAQQVIVATAGAFVVPAALLPLWTTSTIVVNGQVVHGGLFNLLGDLILLAIGMCATSATGLYLRSRRALLESMRDRAEQAEREQYLRTDQAVAQERVHFARELHDVIAHHVSLLVVQAGAVRETLPPDHPSREVLNSMISGGRQAMDELRQMLDALRVSDASSSKAVATPATAQAPASTSTSTQRALSTGEQALTTSRQALSTGEQALTTSRRALLDQPGGGRRGAVALSGRVLQDQRSTVPLAPQPGIADIGELVEAARGVGIPAVGTIEGDMGQVSVSVGLALYRIAQEALTNVIKHAPGAPTLVEVKVDEDLVELIVTNQAAASTPSAHEQVPVSSGFGLMGMRERTVVHQGALLVGPTADGFRVCARFPVGTAAILAAGPSSDSGSAPGSAGTAASTRATSGKRP